MADPSFDIVSKVDRQEVDNALQQTSKELKQRYDFRGMNAGIEWSGEEAVAIHAESENHVRAALDVFKERLVRRNLSIKAFEFTEPALSGKIYKLSGSLRQGIDSDNAKKIAKKIRDEAPKGVQPLIQGDQLRVSGKKKDHLQEVISLLKAADFDIALQFTNYR
ncbi:MAG: YajQ family cyclic di-GMP-binding protein [Acidimicrobiales bacterium]|nr:MAG: YajQ family cyclic di-GMP-binding protein [Acidimicrobiales bacterium]